MHLKNILKRNSSIEVLEQAAASGKIHHAYLFTGPEGCGKFAAALEFAMALHCKTPDNAPCHACPACRKVLRYMHPDFRIIFPFVSEKSFEDVAKTLKLREKYEKERQEKVSLEQIYRQYHASSAQNLVQSPFTRPLVAETLADKNREIFIDNIRELIGDSDRPNETGFLELPPSESVFKTVIILEAEKMGTVTANAFLKTLEEPPSYAKLILITAQPSRLLPTLRSRCQRLAFGPLDEKEVAAFLVEKMNVPEKDAPPAARLGLGSVQATLDFLNPDMADLRKEAKSLAEWLPGGALKEGLSLALSFSESPVTESQRRLLFAASYLREAHLQTPWYGRALEKITAAHEALGRRGNPRLIHSALMLALADVRA